MGKPIVQWLDDSCAVCQECGWTDFPDTAKDGRCPCCGAMIVLPALPIEPPASLIPAGLRETMEREEDVKRVVHLVPCGDRFRYLIETPFKTFPQGVIGTTDATFTDVRIEVRCSSVRSAEEHWKNQ